jgi:hypothetical protein
MRVPPYDPASVFSDARASGTFSKKLRMTPSYAAAPYQTASCLCARGRGPMLPVERASCASASTKSAGGAGGVAGGSPVTAFGSLAKHAYVAAIV